MGLTGSLEDVSVADVLQFVHLGGRSGTLQIVSGALRAEIGFHRGRIISARGPGSRRLGELLVQSGLITPNALEAALRVQGRSRPAPPLGQILVQMGALPRERLKDAVERDVERTVYRIVTWTRGTFDFLVDDLRPVDDLSVNPGDILGDIHVNTEMVLLEAARIFDERNRKGAAPEPGSRSEPRSGPAIPPPARAEGPSPQPAPAEVPRAQPPRSALVEVPRLRLQIVSDDASLAEEVGRILASKNADVVRASARDAGNPLPGGPAPVVAVDLRPGAPAVSLLLSLKRTRPRATLVALADGPATTAAAYGAGALAVAPCEAAAVAACFTNIVQQRLSLYADQAVADGLRAGFAKLRRLLGEFRSGLVTATVSLNLMNIISESVDRAVLFLVRRTDLVVLGAFGHTADGRSLAERSQGFQVDFGRAGVLAEIVLDGRPRALRFADARLPEALVALIGRPASSQCAVFPVLGGQKVVATVYTDNGRKDRPIDDLEFLELATSHVGMAYENELLRRQLGDGASPPGRPEGRSRPR